MPSIPRVTGPSVAEQGLPGGALQSVASPELFAAGGLATQRLGMAAESAGDGLATIYKQERAKADALRVDDALNEATEKALRLQHDPKDGFTAQTGYSALNRTSGMPLADEYTGRLHDEIAKIAGGLANDDQKRMFGMRANDLATRFYGSALSWESTQQKEYTLSVRDATVKNASNALSLNAGDPDNVQRQITRIRSAIEGGHDERGIFIPGSAEMQGKSAAWAKEQADQAVSTAHEMAIKGALETGNVAAASAYFQRYGKEMVAKDVLAVQGVLQKDMDARVGMTAGNQVFDGAAPRIVPNDFTRLQALVMGAESGGRRYGSDGNLLTSTKGAKGEMQVLDSTNKAPGFGVTPAKDDSPDERARVGRDYLAAMVRNYKGDVTKALAAYNAGPGVVDKAVADAGADPTGWLAKMPAETQKYVQGISAQFSAGAGAPAKPTLAELHDEVARQLGPNASPLAIKTAREQITQRYTDQEKAAKQRSEEVVATAMQQLSMNGGRFGELPASTRAALTQFAPDKLDDVMNFGQRIAKGDDSTNPAVYLKLSDQGTLRSLSDAQLYALRGQLSEADFKHFSNERAKLVNGQGGNGPGDLNSSAVKNTLDQRLRELKLDPTPKDGTDDAGRVGVIRRFVDQEVLRMQRDAGKKFTDAETAAAIDKVFAANPVTMKGVFGTSGGPAISFKPGDIPTADAQQIRAAFQKQGVTDPTDAQVLYAWLNYRNSKGKR